MQPYEEVQSQKMMLIAHQIAQKMVVCQCEINDLIKELQPDLERDPENSPDYKTAWNEQKRLIKITVYEFPPKLKVHPDNMILPNRKHKSNYQVVRERWYNLILNALEYLPKSFKLPMQDVLIWITFYFPRNAVIDVDNFNIKFINDGIVLSSTYPDDKYQNMMLVISGVYDKDDPRTEILISEQRKEMDKLYRQLSTALD